MAFREVANHFTAGGDFYLKNSIKDELLQFCVKAINGNYVAKMGVGIKTMTFTVSLHRTPVVSQSEIACPVKDYRCFCFVIYNKPSLLQNVYLLREGKGLLRVFHNKKAKSRPVALPMRGRVPESIRCKDTTFLQYRQTFYRKSA